jgi:hypothetical protein
MKIAQSKTKLGKNVVRNVCHKVIKLYSFVTDAAAK